MTKNETVRINMIKNNENTYFSQIKYRRYRLALDGAIWYAKCPIQSLYWRDEDSHSLSDIRLSVNKPKHPCPSGIRTRGVLVMMFYCLLCDS